MPHGFVVEKPGGCRSRSAEQVDLEEGPEKCEEDVQGFKCEKFLKMDCVSSFLFQKCIISFEIDV